MPIKICVSHALPTSEPRSRRHREEILRLWFYGVDAVNPIVFVTTSIMMIGVGMLASDVPARRVREAGRIRGDPSEPPRGSLPLVLERHLAAPVAVDLRDVDDHELFPFERQRLRLHEASPAAGDLQLVSLPLCCHGKLPARAE